MKKILFALLMAALAGTAQAHKLGESYIFLSVYDDYMEGRYEVTMLDLNAALGLSISTNTDARMDQIEPHLGRIRSYLLENSSFAIAAQPLSVKWTGVDIVTPGSNQYLGMSFELEPRMPRPQSIEVEFTALFEIDPKRTNMLVFENDWKTGKIHQEILIAATFMSGSPSQKVTLDDPSWLTGMWAVIKLGAHHIWIGIDHILFLLALLLPSVTRRRGNGERVGVDSFREALIAVAKVVTVFTLAHSITLSVAALELVRLPSRFVESVIALSIAIAAWDIIRPLFRYSILWVVFAFGLFHGFGFASAMADIGIQKQYLVSSLLGFNIGVELGQLAIVVVVFPILYLLSRFRLYNRYLIVLGAVGLMAISLYWFTERAFEVDLPAGAIVNWIIGREA